MQSTKLLNSVEFGGPELYRYVTGHKRAEAMSSKFKPPGLGGGCWYASPFFLLAGVYVTATLVGVFVEPDATGKYRSLHVRHWSALSPTKHLYGFIKFNRTNVVDISYLSHTMDNQTPGSNHRGDPNDSNNPRSLVRFLRFHMNKIQLRHSADIQIDYGMLSQIQCNGSMCFVLSVVEF